MRRNCDERPRPFRGRPTLPAPWRTGQPIARVPTALAMGAPVVAPPARKVAPAPRTLHQARAVCPAAIARRSGDSDRLQSRDTATPRLPSARTGGSGRDGWYAGAGTARSGSARRGRGADWAAAADRRRGGVEAPRARVRIAHLGGSDDLALGVADRDVLPRRLVARLDPAAGQRVAVAEGVEGDSHGAIAARSLSEDDPFQARVPTESRLSPSE